MLKNSDSAHEEVYLLFPFYEFGSLLLSGNKIVLPEIQSSYLLENGIVNQSSRRIEFENFASRGLFQI